MPKGATSASKRLATTRKTQGRSSGSHDPKVQPVVRRRTPAVRRGRKPASRAQSESSNRRAVLVTRRRRTVKENTPAIDWCGQEDVTGDFELEPQHTTRDNLIFFAMIAGLIGLGVFVGWRLWG